MTADGLTVGVEEEFYLVDDSGMLVHRAPEALRDIDREGIDLKPELLRCQVEAATEVCRTGQDVHHALLDLRARLASAAARHGARLAATATVVHHQPSGWLIAPSPRYHRIAHRYGPIVVSASTCGCHVHVGVADKALALQVINHLRPWLPTLLALSANSPYLHGKDTAHASARHLIYRQWPCADPPPYLESVDEYEAITGALVDSGAALDRKMIHWYIRPSEQQPTVEIRVSDVLATVREATLLAVLTRTLVAHALELIDSGVEASRIPSESLKAGLWRAAKDGLGGQCPDPHTGRLRPVHAILADLIRTQSPRLKESAELELVESTVDWLRRHGGGAHRQRHAFVRRGSLDDVVDEITFDRRRPEPAP